MKNECGVLLMYGTKRHSKPCVGRATIQIKKIARLTAGVLSGLLLMAGQAGATELRPEAVRGFNTYIQRAEQRMRSEISSPSSFLWVDGLIDEQRHDVESRLQHGEVVTERLEGKDASQRTQTPGATIHHWLGTTFIPGATLKQVLFLVQDYNEHQRYFQPQVMRSQLVWRNGDDFRVYLRLKQTKIITAIFDTNHEIHYAHLDSTRAYSISRTTSVLEVVHPGESDEHTLPEGNDNGFLWRLNSYWRFAETPRGVYVQCEAISLSRDIPLGLNFVMGHFVESIAKESLEFTLQSTRAAVLSDRMQTVR